MRRLCFLVCFVLAAAPFFVLGASGAGAETPSQQGWWTATNPGSIGGSPAPPASPDVPPGDLLVEGGMAASSPTAFAALVYQLAPGATVGTLSLQVAPRSATTPDATLELCALANPAISADEGGPMADAPSYDCHGSVTAQPASSGDTYRFQVSSLVADGALAVAVLPTAPTDRVVLSKPDDGSLPVQQTSDSPGTVGTTWTGGIEAPAPPGGSGVGPGPAGSAASAPSAPPVASGTPAGVPQGAAPQPAPTAQPALAPAAPSIQPATIQAPSPQAANSQGTGTSVNSSAPVMTSSAPADAGANPIVVVLLIIAVILGSLMWGTAGRAATRAAAEAPAGV